MIQIPVSWCRTRDDGKKALAVDYNLLELFYVKSVDISAYTQEFDLKEWGLIFSSLNGAVCGCKFKPLHL